MSDNKTEEKLQVFEDEKALLLDHNYDGIHELNHPLPSWWTWTWIACIAFALPYFMYYEMAGGLSLREEFKRDMAVINKIKADNLAKMGNFKVEEYNAWVAANDGVNKGKVVYEENCLSCHAELGGGDIGPNLTDAYWIHAKARTPEELFPIVKNGVEDNGMPAWGEMISKEDMYAAVAYIITLKDADAPNKKEPQGEKVE